MPDVAPIRVRTELVTVPTPGDIVLGDVDGDGTVDAVVSHPEAGVISVLSGVGDGSFRAARTTSHLPRAPAAMTHPPERACC